MNEFAYFKENSTLIAVCLTVGLVFGVILPLILSRFGSVCSWAWDGLTKAFANGYFLWMFMTFQFGFEIFLLMEWVFGYNAVYEASNNWNQYAYLPLTVVIPLFFANIAAFIGIAIRLAEVCKEEEEKKKR